MTFHISEEAIHDAAAGAAHAIEQWAGDDRLVCLGVLNGGVWWTCDVTRYLTKPTRVDFVGASSYGDRRASGGSVEITMWPDVDLTGAAVAILDDIYDTGATTRVLAERCTAFGASRVLVVPMCRRAWSPPPVGFALGGGILVPSGVFLVGHGLDDRGLSRHEPTIRGVA